MNVSAQYVAWGGGALNPMYALSEFAIEKRTFRVTGGQHEAISLFAFKTFLPYYAKPAKYTLNKNENDHMGKNHAKRLSLE